MGDRLTQLQDAVDQVAIPLSTSGSRVKSRLNCLFVACPAVCRFYPLHQPAPQPRDPEPQRSGPRYKQGARSTRRHVFQRLIYAEILPPDRIAVDPHPADVFKAAQVELAQDLITKEQQIEYLISTLPGLENSEQDQERNIKELEEELKIAEAQRLEAIGERKAIMGKLDEVIRSIRRP